MVDAITTPPSEEERLQRAFELADAKLEQQASQAGAERRADKGFVQKGIDLWKSAGAGIAKAGFETSDFIFGEPAEEDKTDLRRGIEQRGRELSAESGWNSLAMGTANIATGLIGAGKIMAPIKAVQKVQAMGKAGRAAVEITKGAVAGATVMDPHEERLSDLIEQFPDLQNPVTEYLSSDPSDGAAEGRFKNALEGIGADLALIGAIKAIKWWRAGDVVKAQKEISKLELERSRWRNANEFGLDFSENQRPFSGVDEEALAANREAFGLPEELSQGSSVRAPEQKVPKNAGVREGPSGPDVGSDSVPVGDGSGVPGRQGEQSTAQTETPTAVPQEEAILREDSSEGLEKAAQEAAAYDARWSEAHHPGRPLEDVLREDFDGDWDAYVAKYGDPDAPPPVGDTPTAGRPVADAALDASEGRVPEGAQPDSKIEHLGPSPQPVDPKTGDPILPTDKVAPKVVRTQEITDDEMTAILDGSRTDTFAIKQYGSVAGARAGGHKFTPSPLPLQKLRTPGGAAEVLQGATRVLEGRLNAAKGGDVLKDSRVQALVNDMAEAYNENPADIIGDIAEAGSDAARMVAQMEAGFRIGNKIFLDANDIATKIRNGNLDEWGGNLAAAQEAMKTQLSIAFDMLASANSVRANAGRALRRNRSEFRITKKDLAKLQSLDTEQLSIVMERAGGDLRKASMILNEKWGQRVFNNLNFHLVNGLLWLWPTHLVNVTTNAMMTILRPTEKLFGSKALMLMEKDPGKRAELGVLARQAKLEFTYTFSSLTDAWSNAMKAFLTGDSILSPHNTEYFNKEITGVNTAAIHWKPVSSIWDVAQNAYMAATYKNIVGLPTRAMGAMDEAFKQMRYRAVVQARAAVEGADVGLTGKDLEKYIEQSLQKAIDPATGAALDTSVLREAQTATFQRDLDYDTWVGSTGRGLQNLRKSDPKVALILPFVKTPLNVLHYGFKMTPGLNLLQKEFMQALTGELGEEARAHAIGQMSLGSLFMGIAAYMTASGQFTGGGPSNPKLMKELVSTGWKPYSLVHTDAEGNKTYFQLGRFDPVGMAFGITADITNILAADPEADVQDLITASGIALAKNLSEKSFLLNLNMAMEAALDPENLLPKYAGRTAGNMLPMSSLIRGHNPDPYLREARTFVDNALRGVPGYSSTLPVTRDWLGQPVTRYVGVMDSQGNDVVEAEHNRIILQTGKGIQTPSPDFEGIDLRDVNLSEGKYAGRNAYEALQELSGAIPGQKSLREVLQKIIESESYQEKPDGDSEVFGTRLNALSAATQRYRQAAKKYLLRASPELQTQIGLRKREARAARMEKRKAEGNLPTPRTFMEIPGVSPLNF